MFCSHCTVWKVGDLDNYCSWCGKPARELTARFIPANVIYGASPKLQLVLENTGSVGNITINRIESGRDWLKIESETSKVNEIKLNQSKTLPVTISFERLANDFQTGFVKVETEETEITEVEINISPTPEFEIIDKPHIVFLDNEVNKITVPVELQVKKGILTIENIRIEDNDWSRVDFDKSAGKIKLDSRNHNIFQINVILDSARIPAGVNNQRFNLAIKFTEFSNEKTQLIHFKCLVPSKLQVPDVGENQFQIKVFYNETRNYILPLQNGDISETGRQTQIINNIKSTQSWFELVSPKNEEFPLKIESGKTKEIKFKIAADKIGKIEENNREDKAEIIIETDSPAPQKIPGLQPVSVLVTEKPVYDGWLCIDFGTTNTCVGISKGKNDSFEIFELDYFKHKIIPTVIRYYKLIDGKRDYSIGFEPYNNLGNPKFEKTIFSQIKRKLGNKKK